MLKAVRLSGLPGCSRMEECDDVQGEGITDILMGPAKLRDTIPGISGTRNLSDNISDLKAQVRSLSSTLSTLMSCPCWNGCLLQ